MCGIVAMFGYRDTAPCVDRDELRRIRDHMNARGPDGSGEWFSEDGRVALGHRRLAIIDLDARAAQPMASADGRLRIVYNGEIYNFRELRTELESRGCSFRTESDTEVLLAAYAVHGTRMFDKLRGMYAFVLWDDRDGSMLVARGQFGIKPVYIADDGSTVRVASQVKALLAGGAVSRAVDPAGVVGFLMFGSVPDPFTCHSSIRALPAGHWVRIDADKGVSEPIAHFELSRVYREAVALPIDGDTARRRAQQAFRDSVAQHLVSDVPVGAFLSGGIDSGSIVGLMHEISEAPTRSVTIRFDEYLGSADDEAPLAEATAQRYRADHRTRLVNESEFRSDLPAILAAMDQPSVDGINTWFAAKACHERGLKVALSGLGGDELLGSYPSFASLPVWVRSLGIASRVPGLGATIRRVLQPLLARQQRISPKVAGLVELGGFWEGAYLLRRGLFMPWELADVLGPDVAAEGLERLDWSQLVRRAIEPDPGSAHARVSCLESSLYMRNQLLRDTDWASMAHSLEVRTPLVDSTLVRAMAPLVSVYPKGSIKQWLAHAPSIPLPPSVVTKRKTGFQTPIGAWSARAPGFDAWRAQSALKGGNVHWSRRMAVNLLNAFEFNRPTVRPASAKQVAAPTVERARPVMHFQRRPFEISYSVERIFHDVREEMRAAGVPVEVRINRYHSKGFWRRMADIVAAARTQGVVNHVTGDVHYLTYLLDRSRTVLTVLDCVGLQRMRGLKRSIFRFLWYTVPLRNCRYVTVISEFTKADLLREVPIDPAKIVVIHPTLSDEFVHEPQPFNAQRPRVLQVGTGHNKNVERVADALRGIECELVVVGRLTDAQRLRLEANELRYVSLTNLTREDLRDAYRSADLVVFASTYEGFGLPIIEANATGRPVITSTVCSMPEVAGDAAALVDPTSVEEIRAAVLRVIGDAAYREQLIASGLRNVERFRVPAIADQYARLYERVASEAPPTRQPERAWNRSAL